MDGFLFKMVNQIFNGDIWYVEIFKNSQIRRTLTLNLW